MSVETMLLFLQGCDPEGRLGFQVAVQCAPVLKGVKISNLMTARPGSRQYIRERLRQSRVICVPLYQDRQKEVLFLYRFDRLKEHLRKRLPRIEFHLPHHTVTSRREDPCTISCSVCSLASSYMRKTRSASWRLWYTFQ